MTDSNPVTASVFILENHTGSIYSVYIIHTHTLLIIFEKYWYLFPCINTDICFFVFDICLCGTDREKVFPNHVLMLLALCRRWPILGRPCLGQLLQPPPSQYFNFYLSFYNHHLPNTFQNFMNNNISEIPNRCLRDHIAWRFVNIWRW